jgi:hypothetical protein
MARLVALFVVFFAVSGSVWACPLCDTETGRQVREGIFGQDFGKNVLLTLAPLPILLGIMALVFWAIPDSKQKNKAT